jgi:hypothetical protein
MKEEVPMKKRTFVMTSLLLLSLMIAAQVVKAQDPVVVNIPFEFVAGKLTLPPGEYRIEKLEQGSAAVVLHRVDRTGSALVMTLPAWATVPASDAKLVFNKYGNRYFLSQYWSAGSSNGRIIPKSTKEKELFLLAGNHAQAQVTLVAGLPPAPR